MSREAASFYPLGEFFGLKGVRPKRFISPLVNGKELAYGDAFGRELIGRRLKPCPRVVRARRHSAFALDVYLWDPCHRSCALPEAWPVPSRLARYRALAEPPSRPRVGARASPEPRDTSCLHTRKAPRRLRAGTSRATPGRRATRLPTGRAPGARAQGLRPESRGRNPTDHLSHRPSPVPARAQAARAPGLIPRHTE